MRDKIHDIDLHTVDAKTVCEVRLFILSIREIMIIILYVYFEY